MSLCEKAGFAENHNATDGIGLRDLYYTWSAAVYLIMAKQEAEETG